MSTTITPSYGNTSQGTQLQGFDDILSSITGMAQPALQNDVNQATGTLLNMSPNTYAQQTSQALTQGSSIPQLQSQYGDLSKIFDLYLHDSGMSTKYAGTGTQMSPYQDPNLMGASAGAASQLRSGNQADQGKAAEIAATIANPNIAPIAPVQGPNVQMNNPYLAPSSDILASANNMMQSPSLTTSEMSQPANAATNMMGLLTSIIGAQKALVSNKTDESVSAYKDKMGSLNSLLGLLQGELNTRKSNSGSGSVALNSSIATDAQTGMSLDQLMKKYGTQTSHDDILKLYNNYSSWGPASENRDDLAKKYGISKSYLDELGLPTAKDVAKQKTDDSTKKSALKGFGNMMNSYYKNIKTVGPVSMIDNLNANKEFLSQKDIYIRQLQKALSASKATKTADAFSSNLPGSVSVGAEGSFKGHLTQVLDANKLQLYMDNRTKNYGIADYDSFDPTSETAASVDDLSIDQIRKILDSL